MTDPINTSEGLELVGFQEPVFEAASIFRAVLAAMSRPGDIVEVNPSVDAPEGLNKAVVAVILTLCDLETALWLTPEIDHASTRQFLTFQTGCRFVNDPSDCDFAVISADTNIAHLRKLAIGSPEYPDRSATVIVLTESLSDEAMVRLSGPGIDGQKNLSATGLPDDLWTWFRANCALFPLGVDLIFASPQQLAALPRSVTLEVN